MSVKIKVYFILLYKVLHLSYILFNNYEHVDIHLFCKI